MAKMQTAIENLGYHCTPPTRNPLGKFILNLSSSTVSFLFVRLDVLSVNTFISAGVEVEKLGSASSSHSSTPSSSSSNEKISLRETRIDFDSMKWSRCHLRVTGMTCSSCVNAIEGVLNKIPGLSALKIFIYFLELTQSTEILGYITIISVACSAIIGHAGFITFAQSRVAIVTWEIALFC